MSDLQAQIDDAPVKSDSSDEQGLLSFTIFWKENASAPLVKTRTVHATDLETASEAAQFLIFQASNTVAVVLAVVPD
jgi:hypothetical protein